MKALLAEFIDDNFRRPVPSFRSGNQKPRIEFIDLAKGVCIILVVLFHSKIYGPATQALRMPLYFILSGLFFKDYGGFLTLLERKVNRLIITFLFFLLLGFISRSIRIQNAQFDTLVLPFHSNTVVNFPIWFLLCLFWCNLIYGVVSLNVKSMIYRGLIVLSIGAAGYVLAENKLYLSLFLGCSFSALPFFYIGTLIRKLPVLYPGKYDRYLFLTGLILLTACVSLTLKFGTPHIDFMANKFNGHPLLILLLSVVLVASLLLVCKGLRWLPIVSYLGRYSIMILGLHAIVIVNTRYMAYHSFSTILPKEIVFAIAIFVCWVSIPFLKRYAAKFTAQKDLIKFSRHP